MVKALRNGEQPAFGMQFLAVHYMRWQELLWI